ncbi:hypothetical protein V491_09372, partial [Pseudogymnoascus sp. VKM F-3775]
MRATRSSARKRDVGEEGYEDKSSDLSEPELEIMSEKKKRTIKRLRIDKKSIDETRSSNARQALKTNGELTTKREDQGVTEIDPELDLEIDEDIETVKRDAARPPP